MLSRRTLTPLAVALASLLAIGLGLSQASAQGAAPPVAKKVPHKVTLHGQQRVDDYHWLRQKDDPAVRVHLEAENAYAEAVMAPTKPLQERLYQEFLGRLKDTDQSAPYRLGGYYYYTRTEEGKQYPIHCRKKGSLSAPEQVLLDLNALAKGEKFMALGAKAVSDDGNLLAYATDVTGFREYTLRVKDLRTGKLLPDKIADVRSVAWAKDNRTLYYVVEDKAKRPYRVYRHVLGARTRDRLVYEEKDERFDVSVERTRSNTFILIAAESHTTTEVRAIHAADRRGTVQLIAARKPGHEYYVDHLGGTFWIRTNSNGARNFRVVWTPVKTPGEANWQEAIPHSPTSLLEHILLFRGHLVVFSRENANQVVDIVDLKTGKSQGVGMPEPIYTVRPIDNVDLDAKAFRFEYQSPISPVTVYDVDFDTRKRSVVKATEVPGFDPSKYSVMRRTAKAKDGTLIPISLTYRKNVGLRRRAPTLLTGYGSYGYSARLGFSHARVSLLDRGVVLATAHVRGGTDLGKRWHDAGRMAAKMNTFTDFIAVAEYLIKSRVTRKGKLVIEGGSAGGLLIGAVLNLRPDLFKAAVAHVPFVDVINTMLDTSLPLTVGEFEEWGNPSKKEEYDVMMKYSPYDNVGPKKYPAILATTSLNDSQVMYWEPAKWVAKLRAQKKGNAPVVLRTNLAGGHGGSSGRYDKFRETAFDYAFVLAQLGITK